MPMLDYEEYAEYEEMVERKLRKPSRKPKKMKKLPEDRNRGRKLNQRTKKNRAKEF